jgi:hypothetical protein
MALGGGSRDNGVVPRDQDRVRLYVDPDGRLTDLLTRLNIETSKVALVSDLVRLSRDFASGFEFVELSNIAADEAVRALDGTPPVTAEAGKAVLGGDTSGERVKGSRTESPGLASIRKRENEVSPSLLAHLLETFGSEPTARSWLSSQCGALNNRTPLEVIQAEGNDKEVERILNCIDYGMLA